MPYKDPAAQIEAQRLWMQRRRAAYFEGKSCAWCGATEDLQLHHRDPSQKVSHRIWSWAPARFAVEAAKCDVICGPCHRRAHAEARRIEAELRHPCGTHQAYRRGCRCDACRAARRDASRVETETKRRKAA